MKRPNVKRGSGADPVKTGQEVFDDLFEIVIGPRSIEWNNSEQLEEMFADYAERHALQHPDHDAEG